MKNSKLAYFSVFHPFRGGIAEFNELLSRELDNNFQVDKYQFKQQYPNVLFPGKSQFIDDSKFSPNTNFNPINPFSFTQTAKQINRTNPSYFLTAYWMPFFAPGLGSVTKRIHSTAKKIALLHNVVPHEKRAFDDSLNRYFLNQFDGYITLSETVTKQLLSYNPKANYKQLFHPNYIQFGERTNVNIAREKLKLPKDKTIVLFFGIIRAYKGLDWILEAIRDRSDLHLVIAGEAYEDYDKYQDIIVRNNLSKHITRIDGFIENELVNTIFSASDFTVLPYKTATQSGIAAIARNFQLPMLVTPVGELANEVIHNETGMVCPTANIEGLKEGLEVMLQKHKEFQQKLFERKEDYTWTSFGKQATDFIKSL
jgi:glycosyltransferase involved in cell wall biosynthesis